eukprot:3721-Heterococcus_DN1.PRE.2
MSAAVFSQQAHQAQQQQQLKADHQQHADGLGGGAVIGALPLNLLECAICLGLICEPITLSCGHSFCRVCLVRTLTRTRKKCPTCRAVCHNSAQ